MADPNKIAGCALILWALLGCGSSDDSTQESSAGDTATGSGGADAGSAATLRGGATASGGSVAPLGGAAAGGRPSTGGAPPVEGGRVGLGGQNPGVGGAPSTGGLGSGGSPSSGGAPAFGGESGSGGAAAGAGGSLSGGAPPADGGTPSEGGVQQQGGSQPLAGEMSQGGEPSNGGQPQAGSDPGLGGAATDGGAGTSGAPQEFPFILGADISGTQESNATYRDTDGQTKSLFELLKNHGFNYIRLRTFVEPGAPYGYASDANGCTGLSETFGDRDHVVAYGKLAKDAGMGFLLDFHYSDTWADPGNQIIPDSWRDASSIAELASLVKDYTIDVLQTAVAAGARPDMVQVGNEITPGMLVHVPNSQTDCWGNNASMAPVNGGTSNFDNLATLLKAGIEGVREVDPSILIMLHIENTDDLQGVHWWMDGVTSRDVDFDVMGLSCYTAFQGGPAVWENTFNDLATRYPQLKFAIAEYNPDRTQANLVIKNLPEGRGLGTFFWEPTRSGEWGESMFSWEGNTAVANTQDFAEYDALISQLGL